MAIINARRAFARASAMAAPWLELRREMLESESRPTARSVSRIIKDSVTTRAKPRFLDLATDETRSVPSGGNCGDNFIIFGFLEVFGFERREWFLKRL